MIRILMGLIIFFCGITANGNEWVSCGEIRPNVVSYTPYYYSSTIVYVPVVQPVIYTPVVFYQNIVRERYDWALIKKYEIVSRANIVYVPSYNNPYRY